MEPISTDPLDPGVVRLIDAINGLRADSHFIIGGLVDVLNSQGPVKRDRLAEQDRRFLIESGEMTAEELASVEDELDRGALQLSAAESWLQRALDTRSLEETAGYLDLTESETIAEVANGRLQGVKIGDSVRFPIWQFNVGRPGRTVKGLERIIKAAQSAAWGWQHLSAYMDVPQEDLIEEGRLTPLTWLQDIGDVDHIVAHIESSVWS